MKSRQMTQLLVVRAWLVFALLLFYSSSQATATPAQRIVSLDLCSDWMLMRYARSEQVLAFSPLLYDYPAPWVADNLPQHDGRLETIVRLQPDLVISGEYNAITLRKRLQQLGFRSEVFTLPLNLQQIQQYQNRFAQVVSAVVGVESRKLPQYASKRRSLLLLGANGIGTGQGTMESELLQHAGWKNYLQQPGYQALSLEAIAASPPDALYYSAPISSALANLFATHPAVAKLPRMQDSQSGSWRWQCPGPWTFDLIDELAAWSGD